jgi:hypothetical protein
MFLSKYPHDRILNVNYASFWEPELDGFFQESFFFLGPRVMLIVYSRQQLFSLQLRRQSGYCLQFLPDVCILVRAS